MKKVLTIHFSQSGQLTEIVTNFAAQFQGVELDQQIIAPAKAFPFPWTTPVFFDTMPETVLEKGVKLEENTYRYEQYDLIIFGYQPWFLSPSLPATALLKNERFKAILKDTPVITLIGSRNMWLNSQESVKKLITEAGGKLVGNVALSDRSNNLVGVITILHWMLKGEKTKKWGIFPKPGVSDADIEGVKQYGVLANEALQTHNFDYLQQEIIRKDGVRIDTNILFIEGRAKRLFLIWANLIVRKAEKGNRTFWVNAFKYYLIFALFIVSPILLLIYNILIVPFTQKSIKKKKEYFQQVKLK
ncbi:hypothetical protein H9Y05_10150 [Crocinitomicaceae bacterium CZZ-1]|uniref:Dialkylrecorsinol condensing enzyme n=1 Tax=Taishania pollutisoli TaxID=2766479 RepID=A0A8J6TTA1_9FLAO|nr:hypothetical protein [Taishania pollutisoli]MBC9812832.1 hypothetical protein [Taishania pollutisoli]MBX2949717.1 hypothetical protein [Crocinitomicaceae bacterium]NGF76137.1 hypothetical protein [Fluviicola sp. SGL-29]